MNEEKIKKQPFAENNLKQQMTVGKVTFTPYQEKPFNIWLKEYVLKNGNQ